MEPKIAAGYERLALNLEEHIRFYKPGSWIVPIHDVASVPEFSAEAAKTFMTAHRSGELKARLEELAKRDDFPYRQLKPWYVKEAISDFFGKRMYSAYESEL